MFRLSDLDELIDDEVYTLNNVLNVPTWEPRSKEDMVKNAIESSKGDTNNKHTCTNTKVTQCRIVDRVKSCLTT